MKKRTRYKIYMISISDHPISTMYKRQVMESWKEYEVNHFEAVTPKDLVYKNKLDFGTKKSGSKKREFTSTEKAVWYSHFELWCKCLNTNTPVVVLEHDSKLIKPLPDFKKDGYKFLSFMNRDWGKGGTHMAPGSGYYITPQVSHRLIANAVSNSITQNSDGHLAEQLNWGRQQEMNDFYYIEQVNIDGLNTIDHKNPNRNFIGQDYEDIDLSSIHRKAV